ncbi:MAG TPA: DUF4129 domain-containing protein, partial [Pseudonocardiaceae bacterium]|nr:DUF4129 domain-containing protein [Pseudonocardiaceae bacterium]
RNPTASAETPPEFVPDTTPADITQPGPPPPAEPGSAAGGTATSPLSRLLPLVVIAVLLMLIPGVIAGEKTRRRRQRRKGDAAERIVGAWQESTDRLVEHGVAVPPSLTAQEVAQRAGQQLGEPAAAVTALAPIVTKAVFCPVLPEGNTARTAWELNAQLNRDLRRADGPLGWIRAWLDPRPLITPQRHSRRRRRIPERQQGG